MRLLYILEEAVGAYLELIAGILIAHDYSSLMHLERRACPALGYAALYSMPQGSGLIVAIDEYHDLLGIHYSTDADGKGLGRHCRYIPSEES